MAPLSSSSSSSLLPSTAAAPRSPLTSFLSTPTPTTRRRSPPSPPRRRLLLLNPPPLSSTHCRASASASASSSSSYNGWADLAAAPDLPSLPLPPPLSSAHGLLLLLLLPASALALSLSRLPPLPLLAAAFTAGFAARHLSAPPRPPRRLAAALADLDARARALRARLADPDPGALAEAVDRLRDAALDAARLAQEDGGDAALPDALPPVLGALGDVAREVADCFGGWARDTLRDLSAPRKKPKDTKVATGAPAMAVDVQALGKDRQAAAAAQAQRQDGNKLADSSIDASNADHKSFGSAVDMLPFDDDANEPEDAGMGSQGSLGDGRLERLVFNRRRARNGVRQNDPFQGRSNRFATESMESSLLERTLEIRDRSYRFKVERRDSESHVSEARDGADDRHAGNAAGLDPMYDESTATDLDGEEFSRNVKEAAEILRKARECMMVRADEETADALLYKSARLLSTAVALRPTSLTAIGQLGNTYLLHGELKLKISRELRTLLANSGAILNGRERVPRSRKVDRRILSREHISSALVDVCEECESLLVEAGRSYKTALSIDSGDVKALYNWGLALIFRGQLLADIGPEAAVDADQVYLAAIDKFDAMLSKSNTYAPEGSLPMGYCTAAAVPSPSSEQQGEDKASGAGQEFV
ncbi:hypothetical protein ACP4OV_014070 [Aristida adscensionis]